MMIHQPASFDLSRYFDRGIRLMVENGDDRERRDQPAVMWALLREAAQVSRTWAAPPRMGYGSKSAMPEAPDSVTEWQRAVFAFEEGISVTQMYGTKPRPQFDAEQHSSAEFTLALFHAVAFKISGARKKLQVATFSYALGMPPRRIREFSGMSRLQLSRAKDRASREMFEALDTMIHFR